MIERFAIQAINDFAEIFPAICIVGPRQVGKTTLAKEFAITLGKPWTYLDMEKPADLSKLDEPELYLSQLQDHCVIIDEVQRVPDLFPLLRSLIDENRIPLRFLLLGSASASLLKQSSESLAGRIAYLELSPFNALEIKPEFILRQHHFRGGFPLAWLAKSDKQSSLWIDQFIQTYLERDLPQLGLNITPSLARKLLEMLAWQNGNLVNYSSLGRALSLTNNTLQRYIDFLEEAFLVKRIYPFHLNTQTRLVKSPKIIFRDTGILHRLLRLADFDQLSGFPGLGGSWESYVINQILSLKSNDVEIGFYRTQHDAEIDLVFSRGGEVAATAEIKYSSAPFVSRGNINCVQALQSRNNYIITPESDDYFSKADFRICNLLQFLGKYLPGI
jgi:predicted AAA+ superfamily ATPase